MLVRTAVEPPLGLHADEVDPRVRVARISGDGKLVVAGHDPQVADRFQQMEPGIIKIA